MYNETITFYFNHNFKRTMQNIKRMFLIIAFMKIWNNVLFNINISLGISVVWRIYMYIWFNLGKHSIKRQTWTWDEKKSDENSYKTNNQLLYMFTCLLTFYSYDVYSFVGFELILYTYIIYILLCFRRSREIYQLQPTLNG